MIIGILTVKISLPLMETIKEKRNVVRSIKDMVRKKFNVSVAEITDNEKLDNNSIISIVSVSNDINYIKSNLSNIINLIENHFSSLIVSHNTDILTYKSDKYN